MANCAEDNKGQTDSAYSTTESQHVHLFDAGIVMHRRVAKSRAVRQVQKESGHKAENDGFHCIRSSDSAAEPSPQAKIRRHEK